MKQANNKSNGKRSKRSQRKGSQKVKRVPSLSNSKSLIISEKQIPVQYSVQTIQGEPKFKRTKNSSTVCIKHSEFIIDCVSTSVGTNGFTGFNCAKIGVNPGLSGAFPWLSSIAKNFVNYKFKNLKFVFKPNCSTNTAGALFMVSDPDPGSAVIQNKKDFLNRKTAVSGNPYRTFIYNPMNDDINKEKSYYCRFTTLPSNSDIKLADCCAFFIAYQGVPTNTLLGELHVIYEVEFSVPFFNKSEQLFDNIETFSASPNGTISANYPMGSNFGIGNILGKFASAGLKYLTGTGSAIGHLFSTDKVINKLIEMTGNIANFLVSGGSAIVTKVLALTSTNLEDPDNIQFTDESSNDMLALFESSPSLFTDVSTTYINSAASSYSVTNGASYPNNSYTSLVALQNVPAGMVIQITGNQSSNSPSTNSTGTSMVVTDLVVPSNYGQDY